MKHPLFNHWLAIFSFLMALGFSTIVLAESSLRVNPIELNKQLNQPGLLIIDSRSPASYKENHIPGALNLPEPATYANKNKDGRITQPVQMQKLIQALGLKTEQPIVIYDNGGLMAAARVFWSLEVYGFKNLKILDQGFEGWIAHDFSMSQEIPKPTPSDYVATINHNRLATKLKTQIATKSPNQTIIDARPYPAYIGEKSSAKRFGHIPTALNIPANHNLQGNSSIKSLQSLEKLKQLYAKVPKDQKVVIYCAIGRVSSTNYLVLRELGYDVSNYDASWNEWGNDFSLPIEK